MNTGDGLPCSICRICVEQLAVAYSFKLKCERTDKCLREVVGTSMKTVKQEVQQQSADVELANNIINDLNSFINSGQGSLDQSSVKNEPQIMQIVKDANEKCDYIEFLEDNQQILTCRVCFKVFTTVEGLRCHKRLHTGGMFKCKVCDKEYTRQNHLVRHELTHSKRKVHVCKICNKTLTRFEHLKRHLTIHLKEKPFACTICNRGFNRQEHLANHMRRCKGDRIHICDICNKGFNREDSLAVHRHLHDNKMPILPTLDNLDNIEEHYYQIDYDENVTFSDNSDNDMEVEDCFEPQINIDVADNDVHSENAVPEKVSESDSANEEPNDNLYPPEDDMLDEKENTDVADTKVEEDNDDSPNYDNTEGKSFLTLEYIFGLTCRVVFLSH